MTMGHGGIFGNPASRNPGLANRGGLFGASAAMPKKKPSFFGEGGAGRNIAGYIGDALLQMSGMQPVYNPAMQDRQRMAFLAQQRAQDRMFDREDWQWKEDYKARNPDPRDPYHFDDNAGNVWEIDPNTGKKTLIFTDLAPKTYLQDGQVINVPNPYAKGADMGADLPQGWQVDSAPSVSTGGTPQPAEQAAQVRAQLIAKFGPARGESEYQKWLQAFGGGR